MLYGRLQDQLDVDDSEIDSQPGGGRRNEPRPRRAGRFNAERIALAVSTVLLLFVGIYSLYRARHVEAVWLDCGQTVAEAESRGCKFDSMMGGWLPADCYDEALSEEWLEGEEGRWYSDINLTKPLLHSEVRKGDYGSAFTRPDFHYKHCSYMMLRFLVGVKNRQMLDIDAISVGHAKHCTGVLADPATDLGPYTRLNVGFPSCAKPGSGGWEELLLLQANKHH